MSDTLTLEEKVPILEPGETVQRFNPEDLPSTRKWTLDTARDALIHIHPDCDFPEADCTSYELWRRIASALITEFGKDKPETFTLFDDWSSGRLASVTPAEYKPEKISEQYESFDGDRGVSMGTVEYWAKRLGWNPTAGIIRRLEKETSDPRRAQELIAEVGAAGLSPLDLETAVYQLQRITHLNKGVIKGALKEYQKIGRNGTHGGSGRISCADELIKLGLECELWKSSAPMELYATVCRGDNRQHLHLSSAEYKRYLIHRYYTAFHRSPSADAISQALAVLGGEAQERGKVYDAHVRVASLDDSLYLDLSDENANVVEITPNGWRLVKHPPVRLIRGAGKPLPIPEKGGHIKDLLRFINIDPNNDFELMKIAAWLVAALRPGFPFPILLVTGEQGSAKTTICNMLKSLVDPAAAQARGLAKTEDDLIVTARTNHILMADNLSGISSEMADAICRLSTGGGIAKRVLYTNGDEYIMEAKRPFIINGINIPTNRQDLLDRSLLVELQPISDTRRKEEDHLWKEFEQCRPLLLGVLLDGVVAALQHLDALRRQVKSRPRMADFALFAGAAMNAWDWKSETFLDGYARMRSQVVADAGRSDAVLSALCEFVQGEQRQQFEGTATLLLRCLELLKQHQLKNRDWTRDVAWPTEANQLTRRIRRGAPGLRAMGIGIDLEAGTTKNRRIQLWSGERKPSFKNKPLSAEQEKMVLEDVCKRVGFG